jgi:GntR family transcriptional regulator
MTVRLAKSSRQSGIPLYVQLATTLRRRIEIGHWPSGSKISTIEELQEEFQVARVTVRQAMDLLQSEGLVQRQQGKGTFVLDGLGDRRWLKLAMTWPALVDTVKDNGARIVAIEKTSDRPRLEAGDGRAAPGYVRLRSVQSRDERPYSIVHVFLATDLYERGPQAFRTRSALGTIAAMDDVAIAAAHQTLTVGSADAQTANLLEVPPNAPIVEAHLVVVDGRGVAIYVADILYRGDCIKLKIDLLESAGARRRTRRRAGGRPGAARGD